MTAEDSQGLSDTILHWRAPRPIRKAERIYASINTCRNACIKLKNVLLKTQSRKKENASLFQSLPTFESAPPYLSLFHSFLILISLLRLCSASFILSTPDGTRALQKNMYFGPPASALRLQMTPITAYEGSLQYVLLHDSNGRILHHIAKNHAVLFSTTTLNDFSTKTRRNSKTLDMAELQEYGFLITLLGEKKAEITLKDGTCLVHNRKTIQANVCHTPASHFMLTTVSDDSSPSETSEEEEDLENQGSEGKESEEADARSSTEGELQGGSDKAEECANQVEESTELGPPRENLEIRIQKPAAPEIKVIAGKDQKQPVPSTLMVVEAAKTPGAVSVEVAAPVAAPPTVPAVVDVVKSQPLVKVEPHPQVALPVGGGKEGGAPVIIINPAAQTAYKVNNGDVESIDLREPAKPKKDIFTPDEQVTLLQAVADYLNKGNKEKPSTSKNYWKTIR